MLKQVNQNAIYIPKKIIYLLNALKCKQSQKTEK